jgi:hypothetical protein
LARRYAREEKEEEQSWTLEERMKRHRLPILDAANDLGRRIHNIRHEGFGAYLVPANPRQELAVQSTLFRLARYFGTLEALYEHEIYLQVEGDNGTRAVASALSDIAKTFASDKYDRQGASSRLIIWREEQRAMGELVRQGVEGGFDRWLGFAAFVGATRGPNASWFANLARDLATSDVAQSERLAKLQEQLADLVMLLDKERRYLGREPVPNWLSPADLEASSA